ncbi:MAG: DUF169 domain-containing protein, partial [Deltaproteobacteria bacterium]|nr:DUF169 domain-containing protein [Deltaproteobacteria bacterium]
MSSLSDYQQTGQTLYDKLHLASMPVAIKYIKDVSEIPDSKIMRPSALGEEWSLCQAFTYARRWGWNVAMTSDDNFCVPSSGSHGWIDVSDEDLLESQVRQGWHQDEEAEKRLQQFTRGLFSKNADRRKEYTGFIVSPLSKSAVVPDTVLIYANGEQITHIIQALVYDGRDFPTSSYWGFGESCIKGGLIPFITQVPQIVIPGTGDRTFSGVFDYEIAIGIPALLIFKVEANLFKTGGRLNMGIPVKTLLARGIKAKLTPGFNFLRKKLEE